MGIQCYRPAALASPPSAATSGCKLSSARSTAPGCATHKSRRAAGPGPLAPSEVARQPRCAASHTCSPHRASTCMHPYDRRASRPGSVGGKETRLPPCSRRPGAPAHGARGNRIPTSLAALRHELDPSREQTNATPMLPSAPWLPRPSVPFIDQDLLQRAWRMNARWSCLVRWLRRLPLVEHRGVRSGPAKPRRLWRRLRGPWQCQQLRLCSRAKHILEQQPEEISHDHWLAR
mmetsp:Transcript_19008/g.57819  ORF Transcript_19008/g.57819 Transcript_19008/m.57819 type:complete len:233 (-) Transcript_19008:253-951(-)